MEWSLTAGDAAAASLVRQEIRAFLERHAVGDLDAAELIAAELLGNAIRHGGGTTWVSLGWQGTAAQLRVRDLGPGFNPARIGGPTDPGGPDGGGAADGAAGAGSPDHLAEGGRGLALVGRLAAELTARAREVGGMDVAAVLPVTKAPATSHDPPPRPVGALPDLSQARPEGGFGTQAFLQALVVQLAATLELQHGPDAAERAVAQVGADVGGQMEAEYRRARGITGRLTPAQLADCYVRLKHAINGGFSAIEVTDERIVLVNTRCPFGTDVLRAPALCRMTSSVFGGIAARNGDDGAAVVLQERIAVGDLGCRVVVHLGPPPPEDAAFSHRYASAATPRP